MHPDQIPFDEVSETKLFDDIFDAYKAFLMKCGMEPSVVLCDRATCCEIEKLGASHPVAFVWDPKLKHKRKLFGMSVWDILADGQGWCVVKMGRAGGLPS